MSCDDEIASAYYAGKDESREKLAAWMRKRDYPTGHGDTIEDLLAELSTELDKARGAIAWRYTCASIIFYTDDPRDVYDNPEVESWTALYGAE
jgi:hypothetical protein